VTVIDLGTLPIQFGGELTDFDPSQYVTPRKAIKVMCRETQVAYAAAALAIEDAGLDTTAVDPQRMGVVWGSEMLYGQPDELAEVFRNSIHHGVCDLTRFGERLIHDLFPLWMLNYLPNMAACHIGIAHQACGPNNSIVQGGASSLLALTEAAATIQRGWTDVMIAGGAGTTMNPTRRVYISNDRLSKRSTDPQAASRPFDAERDGMVIGEGGAAFVLESRRHAAARGAQILATIAGAGRTWGAVDGAYSGPSVQSIRSSIRLALRAADCDPTDVAHVNADGLSTREADCREAQAIAAELDDVAVTAPKSLFGNLGAGSGAVEMVASVLALASGQVPATLNYNRPDPECPVSVIRDRPLARTGPALILNQSATGQAAAVILLPA
jgi:3-oxoacyl-[acyl-carrier-protein] synthase II